MLRQNLNRVPSQTWERAPIQQRVRSGGREPFVPPSLTLRFYRVYIPFCPLVVQNNLPLLICLQSVSLVLKRSATRIPNRSSARSAKVVFDTLGRRCPSWSRPPSPRHTCPCDVLELYTSKSFRVFFLKCHEEFRRSILQSFGSDRGLHCESAVLYGHGEHPSHQRLRARTVPGGVQGGSRGGSVEVPL